LLLKISIEIIVFLALIIVFFVNVILSNKDNWLENLELEIYLNDLTESEIREKLESEYYGISIIKWIEKCNGQLNASATEFFKFIDEERSKIDETKLKETSKSKMSEYLDDISSRLEEKLDDYKHISNETYFQMKEIIKQGFLEKEEKMEIKKISNEWLNQLTDIENKSKEFWNYIREICSCDNCNNCSNKLNKDD